MNEYFPDSDILSIYSVILQKIIPEEGIWGVIRSRNVIKSKISSKRTKI